MIWWSIILLLQLPGCIIAMAELWPIYNWVASAKGRGFLHIEIIKFDSMTALFHF